MGADNWSCLLVGLIIGLIIGMWFWDKYLEGEIMEKEKIVIFESFGKYKFTTEKVYKNNIMDLSKVNTISDCNTAEEVIDTLVKWGIAKREDIIDMTGE